MKTPVARFRGWMVECSSAGAGYRHRVFLGRHHRAPYAWSWDRGHRNRSRGRCRIVAGWASPGIWYHKASAQLALRNSEKEDALHDKGSSLRWTYRLIPVVLEVKLRLRPMVGFVPEPAFKQFPQLKGRKPRQRKAWKKRDFA